MNPERRAVDSASIRLVRHDQANETVPRVLSHERAVLEDIALRSAVFGTKLVRQGEQVVVTIATL